MSEHPPKLDLDALFGESLYKTSIGYAYDDSRNLFTFYVRDGGHRMVPIGMFSTIIRQGIPYDPEHIVDSIAEQLSTYDLTEDWDLDVS
jgi:hypothetical protein|tara:strand:- start:58 stop:324 length:267 start_codon:yes stop_codon:yes gene_type:complete